MTAMQLQFIKQERAIYTSLHKLNRHHTISYGYLWSKYARDEFLQAFYGPDPEGGVIHLPEDHARNFELHVE
jgi:hypothetical protein